MINGAGNNGKDRDAVAADWLFRANPVQSILTILYIFTASFAVRSLTAKLHQSIYRFYITSFSGSLR